MIYRLRGLFLGRLMSKKVLRKLFDGRLKFFFVGVLSCCKKAMFFRRKVRLLKSGFVSFFFDAYVTFNCFTSWHIFLKGIFLKTKLRKMEESFW